MKAVYEFKQAMTDEFIPTIEIYRNSENTGVRYSIEALQDIFSQSTDNISLVKETIEVSIEALGITEDVEKVDFITAFHNFQKGENRE
jgi:hypothetical protein